MIRARYADKGLVVNILAASFHDNQSVNYILKQGAKRAGRLRKLMEYAFDVCYLFGDVFLSDDEKGCALILMPDQKKITLKKIALDIRLVLSVTGLSNVRKAMRREARINGLHPKSPFYYLWFIGVDPTAQGEGAGSKLLQEVINEAFSKGRPVFIETSVLRNIPWYEKFGFTVYANLDFGYKLYCMRKE